MMKLACQEQLLPGDDLQAKFDFARRAGFDGIELRAKGDGHFAQRLPELRAAAKAGVVMRTVCPETDHFIGDFDADQRRDAIEQLRSQLSVIAELEGEGVLTPASWGMFSLRLPPFTAPRTPEEDRKVLLDALVQLGEHAAREGVWLALEAINRYEDYMLNRLDQVVSLAEEVYDAVGARSVRACADLFHLNIEEDDLPAAIEAAGPGSRTCTSTTRTGSSPARATSTSQGPSGPCARSTTTAGTHSSAGSAVPPRLPCPRRRRSCVSSPDACPVDRRRSGAQIHR